jgi:hypothetical protein
MVNSVSDQSDNVREQTTAFGGVEEVQAVCRLVGL